MDNAHSLVVHGRELRYEIRNVDIYEVDYYRDNPRINYVLSRHKPEEVTSDLIETALMELNPTKDLRHDIESNGGLTDEILVLDGYVIEGNTRLCSYRRLYSKTKDDRWKTIRAKVILDEVSKTEIFSLLSNYHIKGKNPWDAFEKAACVYKMVEQGQSIQEVAREVGSTQPKVESMLLAYKTMRDKYLQRPEVQNAPHMESREELRKYSYFEVFFSNKELAKNAETTPQFVDTFVEWVAEGRLPKAECVRELQHVLGNKKAKKTFCEGAVEDCWKDAKEILYWQRPDKIDGFYKKVNQFRELIDGTNAQKITDQVNANPQRKHILRSCLNVMKKFCKEVRVE